MYWILEGTGNRISKYVGKEEHVINELKRRNAKDVDENGITVGRTKVMFQFDTFDEMNSCYKKLIKH